MLSSRIVGWGKYVPLQVLTNADLERMVQTSDAWIQSRTGIQERRVASSTETASTMALEAGRQALAVAGLPASAVDLIVTATCTPDALMPSASSLVQHGLGAQGAAAFDLNAACSGFVYALAVAHSFLAAGVYRTALVLGSDIFSRVLDWSDRNTCVLFGDGAGAVVLQRSEGPGGVLGFVLGSDGSHSDLITLPSPSGPSRNGTSNGRYMVEMKGREVFRHAVQRMQSATRQVLAQTGLSVGDLDLLIPHQANLRIVQAVAKDLGVPWHKVYVNLNRYGNTSAASIPLALCEALEGGRLRPGDHVALAGFGSGLSWGSVVLRWV